MWREENRRTRSPWSKHDEQQQSQPTYDAGSRIRTQATLVGGERSNCRAIPAPLNKDLNKEDNENKTRSYETLNIERRKYCPALTPEIFLLAGLIKQKNRFNMF